MKLVKKLERGKGLLAEIDAERKRVAAWDRLNEQRAVVLGCEIALLKSLGWLPTDEIGSRGSGQALIDAGEPCLWTRGVVGEPSMSQAEALALAEGWWIEEQNARGWKATVRT